MKRRKAVVIGLIGAGALTVGLFCTDYGYDGWRFLGWHTELKSTPPKVRIPNRYANATNDKLRTLGFEWHETQAIFELGRRGARDFESQMKTAAEAPPWETPYPLDANRIRKFEFKIAALAVLAKWKFPGAEEDLLRGAAKMPNLERAFVPALAYVNTTQSVRQLKMYKGYLIGMWKCGPGSNDELQCSWTGLEY